VRNFFFVLVCTVTRRDSLVYIFSGMARRKLMLTKCSRR
jgi:hypothetical protein